MQHRARSAGGRDGDVAAHSSLELSLLAGFELQCAGRLVALPWSAERLLAFLALQGGVCPRSFVAGTLWPEVSDSRAAGNLRSSLWRLRRTRRPLLEATSTSLRLGRQVSVDIHELMAVLRMVLSDPGRPTADLRRLLDCSDLLPGWYEEWVVLERERFRQMRLHALEALCERFTAERRFGPAVEAGLAAVGGDPLRESAHRVLMGAYLAEGNASEAVREYRAYCRALHNELGLGPSAEMEELARLLPLQQTT